MRISDSNVVVNIQRSDERVQTQDSRTVITAVAPSSDSLDVAQARMDYFREDVVSLSSRSVRSDAQSNVSAEFARDSASQSVATTALEGMDAWRVLALQGVVSSGVGVAIAGTSVELHVETAVTQQVQQSTLFTAQGTVTDESGATISFQLGLALQSKRELKAESEFTLVSRPRTDPLVINFAADGAQLSDLTFNFDLNGDGAKETLAQLGSGSGYLVFDKNANGVADNGNELFGTFTGDGFAELRQLNSDRDLWLDENDAAFSQLSVWVRDEKGSGALFSLKELGVGAIYLGASADDFELTSKQGVPLGSIRAHSIVLMENGDVRTAQQLDLNNLATSGQASTMQSASQVSFRFEAALDLPPAAPVPSEAERVRLDAIDKLNRVREQQVQYRESLREPDEKPKAMLQQLLEKMDELRLRYREAQAQRERVARLYHQHD